jgi:uncharacterized protein with LGFP repeats
MLDRYVYVGETESPLGLPISDVREIDGGHAATFERGGIYKKNALRPHALWGEVWKSWRQHDKYRGPLGYPTSDVGPGTDGRGERATFVDGAIYHRAIAGTFALWGPVHMKYHRHGEESGALGFPSSEIVDVTNANSVAGLAAAFKHGTIAGAGSDVHAVWGPIHRVWGQHGGIQGDLGYPLTDVIDIPKGQRCRFEHGVATYNATTDTVTVTPT